MRHPVQRSQRSQIIMKMKSELNRASAHGISERNKRWNGGRRKNKGETSITDHVNRSNGKTQHAQQKRWGTELQIGAYPLNLGAHPWNTRRYGLYHSQPFFCFRTGFPENIPPSGKCRDERGERYRPGGSPSLQMAQGDARHVVNLTHLRAPTPKPPMALPTTRSLNLLAPHCKADPTQKTTNWMFDDTNELIDIPGVRSNEMCTHHKQ